MTENNDVKNPWEQRNQQKENISKRMSRIKHKIAIISGKGGVGKSLVTVNLAAGLAANDRKGRVAILDADLTGPCIPKMLGLKGEKLNITSEGISPVIGPDGLKVISMDFLLPSDDAPVIWRGPLKMGAINQFLGDVNWGSLEFLLVDLPPGTGDEALSVLQLLPEMDGIVIVTIPSEVSQGVVKKAVTFARKMNVHIYGIVENMSGLVCPHCGEVIDVFSRGGGAKVAKDMGVPFLGSIPLDPLISAVSDSGKPFIIEHPDSPGAETFNKIIETIEAQIAS